MFSKASAFTFLLACQQYGAAAVPTWPASTDELEDILYLSSGYRARGFATPVNPCTKGVTAGRITAAEWVRTVFHDAISGNVFTGEGGLDGSIAFELDTAENAGNAFPSTVGMFAPYLSNQTSLADIIAAGIYTATRSCGGPVVPVRGGRKDATTAGPVGFVPQPQNAVGIFKNQFARLGLDTTGMIQLVACGHTLGGVHASDNPLILDPGTAPNDFATMDTTPSTFDSKIATEFVSGTTKDPLVVGKSITTSRNSDSNVFRADNNVTIKAMQDAQTFASTCQSLFQKMIEVVPKSVTLTDPVTPYEVKPYDIQLTLLGGGTKLKFAGDVRIRTTQRSNVAQVQLVYKDRTGAAVSSPIDTTLKGSATGLDDSFIFLGFSTELSADSSISSFNVVVTAAGGSSQTFDNNGNGFKVDDTIIFQSPQSCLDNSGKLTAIAAVRNDVSAPSLQVVVKTPRASPNPVPSLSTATTTMATQSAVGSYQLYSADYTFSGSQASSAVFGVFAGSSSDNYKTANALPTACTPLSTSPPTSSPNSTAYAFQGCYYDAGVPRALPSDASFDDSLTVEKCFAYCSRYQYFGLEYGRECYCGNTRDATSTIQALSDCNMACKGDAQELCGAANRMSLYKNNKYTPTVNPQIAGYNHTGCYSEGSAGRALSDSATNSDALTVETCAAFCGGAVYFGVEYGRECYCGNMLNEGSVIQPLTDCNMVCAGNTTEYCGAGNRLNIYKRLAASSSSASSTTVLSSSSSFSIISSSSILSSPISSHLSDLLPSSSVVNTTSSASMTSTVSSSASSASSNPTSSPSILSPSSSSMSTASSTVISSSTSLSPSSTPSSPTFPGYEYAGCLTDTVGNRSLTDKSRVIPNITYPLCASFCSGYQYFGLEYGSECYCGNSLAYIKKNPETDCNIACTGDTSTTCGGSSRLTVFNSTSIVTTPKNPNIAGYTYKGCYTDSVGTRTLNDDYIFDAAMTVEKCATGCSGKTFFGTEYGGECYCGDVLADSASKVVESECSFLCGGNDQEYCGAANRLTVYELSV